MILPAERLHPTGLARPSVYAHVVKTGTTVYIAGQVAQHEAGAVVGRGEIDAQATQVFENLAKALAPVGADSTHLVKITTYLTDPRHREVLAAVRAQYLRDTLPTKHAGGQRWTGQP